MLVGYPLAHAGNGMKWLALLVWMLALPAYAEEEDDSDPPRIDPVTGRVLGAFEVVEEEEPPEEEVLPEAAPEDFEPLDELDVEEPLDGALSVEDSAPSGAEQLPLAPIDTTQAQQLQPLNKRLYRWLRPDRGDLEQVPRSQTDFTAYTLEFGEVKVGLANITAGVLPRVQVGTAPLLHALDLPNISLKANPVRILGFDLAATSSFYALGLEEFQASYLSVGGRASVRLMKPWTLHFGGESVWVAADGMPDLEGLAPILSTLTGAELNDYALETAQQSSMDIDARLTALRVATDIRFNRRDSLILQASTTIGGEFDSAEPLPPDFNLPPILGIDLALDGPARIDDSVTLSVAWQLAWKHTELRMGMGYSTSPGAWLMQATELSYRFGGKTRRSEYRMRRTWRKNRHEIDVPQNQAPTQSEIDAARERMAKEGIEAPTETDVEQASEEQELSPYDITDDERSAQEEEEALLEEEEALLDDD